MLARRRRREGNSYAREREIGGGEMREAREEESLPLGKLFNAFSSVSPGELMKKTHPCDDSQSSSLALFREMGVLGIIAAATLDPDMST